MALGRTRCVALIGIQGHVVDVEADVSSGLPAFTITGLPDASLGEARDRVRAACANSGVAIPPHRITVNLSPASIPKAGTSFDLAIAVAVLVAGEAVPEAVARDVLHLGELGLDGRVRPVRGVLPAVLAAAQTGVERVVVPTANVREAELVPGVQVLGADSVGGLVARYRGEQVEESCDPTRYEPEADQRAALDLADVVGQGDARRALEVAAAGGHHLFLLGPPGAGKTMLAARLPSILPDLTPAAALEVTAVHSLAGSLAAGAGLITRPPFVDPHHTASAPAVVGGGSGIPRPGAASRAHHGILFLDEAPEFERRVLDALRQPLECGELVIHRAAGQARYPARFQLVLAANPCPCGQSSGKGTECTCTPMARRRYLHRLSGPLLDRVDLQVEVLPVTRAALATVGDEESSAVVAARVAAARAAQRERWREERWSLNAHAPGHELRRQPWRLPAAATASVDRGVDRGTLTVRGYDRVLRTAWTLADLDGRDRPGRDDVDRAFSLRHQAAA
ncbi:YifB family Mg chelatase-like AAA ATPase [Angustibacter sp. Root456]|uniref:YifB family Mg chelatase-like AAA ATPase n=1 Tax=Angustibacter sp. Root456 TaxID=1736539 RepID=UPI0007015C97|nr:YifB family Mg chelatase-like AAA ATPase [Angustibacter sp. Root456]KQX63730.1 Mg chelatase-like protein [Angustibacter sp. Root456]